MQACRATASCIELSAACVSVRIQTHTYESTHTEMHAYMYVYIYIHAHLQMLLMTEAHTSQSWDDFVARPPSALPGLGSAMTGTRMCLFGACSRLFCCPSLYTYIHACALCFTMLALCVYVCICVCVRDRISTNT
jgi:hypothetical protein